MLRYKKIKVGKKYIEAVSLKLLTKSFILLKGRRGYVMCGYLDLKVAEKFKDVGARIVGVSTIRQALNASVHSCTQSARRLGIFKGQPIKGTLKIIA